jgi:hypothetical protein
MTQARLKSGIPAILLLFVSLFADLDAFAQTPDLKGTTVKPNQQSPSFNADILDPQVAQPAAKDTPARSSQNNGADYYYEDSVKEDSRSHWARGAVGIWLVYSNNGVSPALIHKSQDEVLLKHSSEKVFGLGTYLDFGTPAMHEQSWRLGFGLLRANVSPDASVSATYAANQLEDTLGIFQFSLLYRLSTDFVSGFKTLWYGFGGQVNYVFSSNRPGGGNPVSNLTGTYGISPVLAVGFDMPFASYEDISFDLQWQPWGGFATHIGLRTSL